MGTVAYSNQHGSWLFRTLQGSTFNSCQQAKRKAFSHRSSALFSTLRERKQTKMSFTFHEKENQRAADTKKKKSVFQYSLLLCFPTEVFNRTSYLICDCKFRTRLRYRTRTRRWSSRLPRDRRAWPCCTDRSPRRRRPSLVRIGTPTERPKIEKQRKGRRVRGWDGGGGVLSESLSHGTVLLLRAPCTS